MTQSTSYQAMQSDVGPQIDSVAQFLALRNQTHPNKVAVCFENRQITYKELFEKSIFVAQQLEEAGIKSGDKVAVMFQNHSNYVAVFFAVLGLGATVVPINPLLKADEIAHVLRDSEANSVIVHQLVMGEALSALATAPSVKAVFVDGTTDSIKDIPNAAILQIEGKAAANFNFPRNVERKALGLLVYTSGTTGKPKGAMLTHDNLLSVFPDRLDIFDIGENDVILGAVPLCHIYGMTVVVIGSVAKAVTLVVQTRFEPKATLSLIEKHKITLLPLVPAMYQFLLMELANTDADLSSVRICFSGASALAPELISKIESKFGAPLAEGYALTETACVATINPLHGPRLIGSVGPAVPGVDIEIVSDNGQFLPPGKDNVGEIAIKGPNIMLGYYKQPEASSDVLRDGWFYSGDLGCKDEAGYVYIVGRKKEMIIRGGQNIYPREIEEVILKMQGVAETAVIGVEDKLMGERVKAFVVTKDSTMTGDDVKNYCAKHLAEYKVPRLVEFIDVLPRNSTGKVLKRLLS